MSHDILVPESFSQEQVEEVETSEVQKLTATEMDMASLNTNPGFRALKEIMRDRVKAYRELRMTDLQGKKLEEIGQAFIVASTVADELEGFITQVEKLHELKELAKPASSK